MDLRDHGKEHVGHANVATRQKHHGPEATLELSRMHATGLLDPIGKASLVHTHANNTS